MFISVRRMEARLLCPLFILIVGWLNLSQSFIVEPLGLSGAYIPFGNYAKAGKAGPGVSWSKNLDGELQLRKTLCQKQDIPETILYQYRYDNATQRCYKVGEKGPCGENMIFFAYSTNAAYGSCDCNYNDNGRPLIYEPTANKCHYVYTRGYCEENEWLTFNDKWKPVCEPNRCLQYYDHKNKLIPSKSEKSVSVEFIPYENGCAPLGESCYDVDPQWSSLAHLPLEVQFVKGKLKARCAPVKYAAWRYPTPKMQCVPGGFLYTMHPVTKGKCHILFEH
ncbi:hypothetical protein Ocin01_07881 [Orchesella cincta]|uniref:DUF4789 domain-containing protein n=1 Tax=Orchesella cincta TaxID=48709 RepID=A0A1D2N0I3_ORCCI|nr:hypothetical protein Ocin01_07881 [Orchesella cincta]